LPPIKNRKTGFHYGYAIVISVFFIMIIIWGTAASFGVFFESLIWEFGWSRSMTSVASALRDIFLGIFCILTARLIERFGPRKVITVLSLVLGLSYFLMSQISAAWQMFLFTGVLMALGMSGYIAMLSLVVKWFERRKGLMTGIVLSGMGLGIMVIPRVASQLISSYDWRNSYVILAIFSVVIILIAAQFLRKAPTPKQQRSQNLNNSNKEPASLELSGLSFREVTRTRQFYFLCVLYFAFLFCLQAILVHIVIHATGLGFSALNAANTLTVIGGACIVGMNIMGSAADRMGNKLAITLSFILMALSLFWVLTARDLWMLYLFGAIFGFAYGGVQALFSPLTAELFGLRSHGTILSSAAFVGTIGAASGPIAAGRIFDVTKSYNTAFLTCAIIATVGFIVALFLKPVKKREKPS